MDRNECKNGLVMTGIYAIWLFAAFAIVASLFAIWSPPPPPAPGPSTNATTSIGSDPRLVSFGAWTLALCLLICLSVSLIICGYSTACFDCQRRCWGGAWLLLSCRFCPAAPSEKAHLLGAADV